MPIHDWTRTDVGLFRHFRQSWICELCDALNAGTLPSDHYALIEKRVDDAERLGRPDLDVYTGGINRIGVRNASGELVAVIELVSPGNKDSRHALRAFVEKAAEFLARGVNLLVIDLFPPTPRDPQGIHKAIWDEIREEPFELPADKPLTLAAYAAWPSGTAYVEPVAVGDPLPPMPLFLDASTYVPAPLEDTYARTWDKCPRQFRELVENDQER